MFYRPRLVNSMASGPLIAWETIHLRNVRLTSDPLCDDVDRSANAN